MRLEFDPNASNGIPIPAPDDKTRFVESLNAGIKAAQAGERKTARSLLMTAAEIDPRSENAWLWLASISEYPEELLVFLNNVLDINPENERALQWSTSTKSLLSKTLVQRGIDAVEDGRNDFAMQCFDQALAYDERNQMAWLWIASIADSEERKIEYLQRVLSIDPENQAARTEIQAAVEQSVASRMSDAVRSAVAGDHEIAGQTLDSIIRDCPENEDAWVLRSHLAVGFDDKVSAWSRVAEINPANKLAGAVLESLRSIIASVPAPALESKEEVPFSQIAEEPFQDLPEVVRDPTQELVMPESLQSTSAFDGNSTMFGLSGSVTDFEPAEDDELSVPVDNDPWTPIAADDHASAHHFDSSPSDVHAYPTVDAFALPEEVFSAIDEPRDNGSREDEFQPAGPEEVDDIAFSIPMPGDGAFLSPETGPSNDPYATHVERRQELVEFEPVDMDEAGSTILVIDDNATVRKLIAGKLEESGYRVACAESGGDGVQMARASRPALVLLDVALPKIDGYQICRMLRDDPSTSGVPVIMISGKDAHYDENLGNEAGASGFITKPFGPEALMKVIESHLVMA